VNRWIFLLALLAGNAAAQYTAPAMSAEDTARVLENGT